MSKITESARGMPCQVRLEGCMPENETVVYAHMNGGGMGTKQSDLFGMYACINCHDIIDGRKQLDPPIEREWLELEVLRAVINTQKILMRKRLITVKIPTL